MADQQYTIQSATFSKEKQISGNPMHIYVLDVVDGSGQVQRCELLQRPTSPQPQQGQQLTGYLQPSSNPQMLPTFKRAQQNRGGGGGGGRGGGYGPEDIARITRSHSQQMAIRFLEATGGATIDWTAGNDDDVAAEANSYLQTIKRLADWFQADVNRAAKAVAGGGQQAPSPAQQAPPPQPPQQQQAPPPQPPPQQAPPAPTPKPDPDDDIPF